MITTLEDKIKNFVSDCHNLGYGAGCEIDINEVGVRVYRGDEDLDYFDVYTTFKGDDNDTFGVHISELEELLFEFIVKHVYPPSKTFTTT